VTTTGLIDRHQALRALEECWERAIAGRPQLALVWGRRRVGKTFLLSHLASGKRAVFFGATQQAAQVELQRLMDAVRRDLGEDTADLAGGSFGSWEAALRFFAALATREPLMVVLDEVPYLARSTDGFASVVQVVWDHLRPGTRLMLVLTGSAVGVIEDMLGAGAALRGRPTLSLRLDPLDPTAARTFLPRLDATAFLEAYAACGGYPLHLLEWDQAVSTPANLVRLAGTPGSLLLEDAAGILREELPETGGYPRILAAIGRGRTRYSAIASEADQRVEHPLDVLVHAGFVRKSLPVGAPKGARPDYEIDDAYLAFWFGVLYSSIPDIEAGQGSAVLRRVEPLWQRHLGLVFEAAARAHARHLVQQGVLPDDLVVGRWWATSGQPCEVDVLGLRGASTVLLGEARWQQRPLDGRDLEALRRKTSRVPRPVAQPIHALWGRGGVQPDVLRAGAMGFDLEATLSR
jgi:AAA+ ATPase superfamily predicted ATPase